MEEAPKPTFQDELEWCISQLEAGLLRLNPTPKQAEETRRILGVLRSRKAPLVKKRQVMHHVFGDYRLKMAEEIKKAAKAAVKPEEVHIQPGNTRASGSMVYRKQSSHPSGASTSWFTPSDKSFQFGFVLPENTSEEVGGTTETSKMDNSRKESSGSGSCEMLDFLTGTEKPEFAFNFVIQDDPPPCDVATDPDSEAMTEIATEVNSTFSKVMVTPESVSGLDPEKPDVVDNGSRKNEDCPAKEAPKSDATQVAQTEAKDTKLTLAVGASSKRKKKKKQPPLKALHSDNVNGESRSHGEAMPGQDEICQSEEQLKREVDWCVEQLELGLKTQKSTPKQSSEALRAIKILRSEKVVLAKKRQMMRAMFGDYRTKMAEERRKQLKLMQAASKAAHITEVMGETCRKGGQVFRKSTVKARSDQNPAESNLQSTSATCTKTADTSSFVFVPSQEEFHFNFF